MPTWNEICQVLEDLRILILETQIELADRATVYPGRFHLQQFLVVCVATWIEIMKKYEDVQSDPLSLNSLNPSFLLNSSLPSGTIIHPLTPHVNFPP